jgi:hypothetical protein
MGAESTTDIQINLRGTADTSAAKNEYDSLFADLKAGVVDALSGQGVDSKFISHVADEFDRLNKELKETGASGDVVAEKIAHMQANLVAAAEAEERRVRQLKVNFEVALEEKDLQEQAAAQQRMRRSEDQLAMEAEGRELKKNTELLEQEVMARLKAERVQRESATAAKSVGTAMQGTKRDIAGATLQAAQFADDMQYGLRAVTNQIPQLAMALGLGTGVAGILGIAAVAVNLLWNKFGGAKDAKAETDKVTESLAAMRESLQNAGKASEEVFKKDLAKYTADVDRSTHAWETSASVIEKILGYHNELASLQNKMANSQLEIQRQNALGAANTDDERKAVNTQFDSRKAALNDAGEIEQAKRNLAAQQAHDEMLRRKSDAAADTNIDAQGRLGQAKKDQKGFVDQFGDQSDQGRRVREAEAAQQKLKELQENQRKVEALLNSGGYERAQDRAPMEDKLAEIKGQVDAAAKDRDVKNTGIAGDKAALESGKGLKFDGLNDDAKKAEKEGDASSAAALVKLQAEALKRQQQIEEELKFYQDAVVKATADLAKIREEEVESERALVTKKMAVQAAELKDSEDFVKAGTAKVIADKEAAEKQAKKDREERARKLENDAKAAEQRGDHDDAQKLHTQAERAKLPADATAEQKRQVELEAKERAAKAKPTTISAGGVTDPLTNLAASLGPAGAELGKAVNKLKDGADSKELQAVLNHLTELTPMIEREFGANEQTKKKLADVEKQLASLKSQLRSTQL